jgi:hypothetical protein
MGTLGRSRQSAFGVGVCVASSYILWERQVSYQRHLIAGVGIQANSFEVAEFEFILVLYTTALA